MRVFRLILIALLAGVIAGAFPFSEPVQLIRIDKGDTRLWSILTREQIDVVQELQTCYLARADRHDIAVLRRAGVTVRVIDRDPGEAEFVLLPSIPEAARTVLGQAGRLTAIEPGILLFRAGTGDAAAVIAPGLRGKRLPPTSILPYLRPQGRPAQISPGSIVQSDIIRRLVAEVSLANLRNHVQTLQDFVTRYTATPGCEAAGSYIYSYFAGLGLDVSFQEVRSSVGLSRNVIAELPGRVSADGVLIICGHYDSYCGDWWEVRPAVAPGADDNASGTAAVMEAARILSMEPLDFTVRFIAFTGEEQWMEGSLVYADSVRSRGERIIAVLNLDMIAYADKMPEDLEVYANPASDWLAARFVAVSEAYGLIKANRWIDPTAPSDQSSFWDRGYPAVLAIEDQPYNPYFNPHYHTTSDTVDTLNFEFYTQATKASLATLAELAQPIRPGYPATPSGLTAKSNFYVSLFGALRNNELNWAASPGASGYNVYRSETSHHGYQKLNSSPLTRTSYTDREFSADTGWFYVVTAVGPTGLESNNSVEVEILPGFVSSPSRAAGRLSFVLGRER